MHPVTMVILVVTIITTIVAITTNTTTTATHHTRICGGGVLSLADVVPTQDASIIPLIGDATIGVHPIGGDGDWPTQQSC